MGARAEAAGCAACRYCGRLSFSISKDPDELSPMVCLYGPAVFGTDGPEMVAYMVGAGNSCEGWEERK